MENNMKLTQEEARKKWIEALRSGNYKQTKRTLWRKDKHGQKSYCCLGVAMELFDPTSPYMESDSWNENKSKVSCLNKKVCNLLGLRGEYGAPNPSSDKERHLWELNDKYGFSFEQIADVLETGEYWKNV